LKYTKSTRYALYAAMQMALASDPVTVSQVAARYSIPRGALAKVFQDLVRAGLALGVRGVGGGYRLARPAAKITVLDVITIFDPPRPDGACLLNDSGAPPCDDLLDCRLRRLFDEVDELARCTFASVTLETLVGRPVSS
jgi:Rrf2 family protein